jgi:hypothetical protein
MHNAVRNLANIALFLTLLGVAGPGQNVGSSQDNSSDLASSNTQEIPLSEVWSNRIPETRDIFKLEAEVPDRLMRIAREFRDYCEGGTLTQQISKKLRSKRRLESRPKMFAVLGHGAAALRAAHDVLVNGKEPKFTFTRGDRITLVFYTHPYNNPIHIQRIAKRSSTATVSYQVASYYKPVEQRPCDPLFQERTMASRWPVINLALIPIDSIQPGELSVEVKRVASENTDIEQQIQKPLLPIDSIDYVVSGPCKIDIR